MCFQNAYLLRSAQTESKEGVLVGVVFAGQDSDIVRMRKSKEILKRVLSLPMVHIVTSLSF